MEQGDYPQIPQISVILADESLNVNCQEPI